MTAALAQTTFVRNPKIPIDEDDTKKITEYTTEPLFSSPLVDDLPASKTVPTPKAVLGDVAVALEQHLKSFAGKPADTPPDAEPAQVPSQETRRSGPKCRAEKRAAMPRSLTWASYSVLPGVREQIVHPQTPVSGRWPSTRPSC